MSSADVSKPIFDIEATEDKTDISIPMLSGLVKNFLSFGFLDSRASPKSSGGGFSERLVIPACHHRARQAKIL